MGPYFSLFYFLFLDVAGKDELIQILKSDQFTLIAAKFTNKGMLCNFYLQLQLIQAVKRFTRFSFIAALKVKPKQIYYNIFSKLHFIGDEGGSHWHLQPQWVHHSGCQDVERYVDRLWLFWKMFPPQNVHKKHRIRQAVHAGNSCLGKITVKFNTDKMHIINGNTLLTM